MMRAAHPAAAASRAAAVAPAPPGDARYAVPLAVDPAVREEAELWLRRGRQFHIEYARGQQAFYSNHYAHNIVCLAAAGSPPARFQWWWDVYTPKLQPRQAAKSGEVLGDDSWQDAIRPDPYGGTYPQVRDRLGRGLGVQVAYALFRLRIS